MLRGLKECSSNITAVVTVADDGEAPDSKTGPWDTSSRDIRTVFWPLPIRAYYGKTASVQIPGRNAERTEFWKSVSCSNGWYSSSFEQAVQRMSDVLAVKGRVLPVTLEDIQLCAELEDGYVITGESQIGNHNSFHRCAIRGCIWNPER